VVEVLVKRRVVLDTNVCLDIFVFRDPRCADLRRALHDGAIEAVTRADCRREWEIVLGYDHLPLDEEARLRSAGEFGRLIKCLGIDDPIEKSETRLPVCRDRDDQKFLELARDAGAEMLITKDKALLKLAGKCARAGLFRIVPPEKWQID
jgi:putative PIN family toxin of toxin-antitoxin system